VAIGSGYTADFSSSLFIFVIRARGANSDALVNAFKSAMAADASPPPEWTGATVGGKQVQVSSDESGATYLYATGDVLFWTFASSPALAEEVLSGLPEVRVALISAGSRLP